MKVVSMRGESIDMGRLMAQHENTVALGNAGMNARGDLVGPGGKVLKKRETIAMEYHNANPRAVRSVPVSKLASEVLTPAQAVQQARAANKAAAAPAPAPAAPAPAPAAAATPAPEAPKRKLADSD